MTRIQKAFDGKKAFLGFITAGDPDLEKTEEYVLEMERAGASLIELGIPFSDPVAEGPVIQSANVRALSKGCTTDQVFELVERLREKTQIPIVFLLYLNSIFKYGYERFCQRCEDAGVDGLIIPDLPWEERGELSPIAQAHQVDLISMIAPTSEDRIRQIAKEAKGFLYVVSSMGVTGMRQEITTDIKKIVDLIREVTDTPTAIGFGINTKEQVHHFSEIADGAIVGSAIVKIVEKYGDKAGEPVYEYVKEMVSGLAEMK
jgi:tryptophan synthase alpha chain